MIFSSEQGRQLRFADVKISKLQDVDDVGIFKIQCDPEFFQYIVICHQYLPDTRGETCLRHLAAEKPVSYLTIVMLVLLTGCQMFPAGIVQFS